MLRRRPFFAQPYLYYGELDRLIETLPAINHMVVQGGEVLIQKKTIDWLRALSLRRPGFPALITNGNVEADMVPFVESLFQRADFGVRFPDETYRASPAWSLKTPQLRGTPRHTKQDHGAPEVPGYPLNLHELPLFLRWAIALYPETISVIDSEHRSLHQQ